MNKRWRDFFQLTAFPVKLVTTITTSINKKSLRGDAQGKKAWKLLAVAVKTEL